VGDAEILEPVYSVDRERVERYHVHLERFGCAAVLGSQRVNTLNHVPELRRITARVDPTVPGARRAPQRDIGMTADEERDRPGRGGTDLAALELQYVTVVLEPP